MLGAEALTATRCLSADGKATSLLSDPRLAARPPAGTVELPPPGKCPTAILRHPARTRRNKETFEQCLARHGKDISKRIVTKCALF